MLKILVIDDEKEMTDLFREYFERRKYQTFTANGGEEGLKIVREQRPQLVFLDICMPGMNGVEVLRKIKEIDPEITVAMVTAFEKKKELNEALACGAEVCFRKPFRFDELEKNIVSKVLEKINKKDG